MLGNLTLVALSASSFWSTDILLGLTVQEFLLHLLNFVILVVALRFLLYKPVKKFMQKRKDEYDQAEERYKDSLKKSEEAEKEAEKLVNDAREEAVKIAEDAHALALQQQDKIIADAQFAADEIMKNAAKEAVSATQKEKEKLYYSVPELAVQISEKLLGREIKGEDNDAFIDSLLEDLKKKDGEDNA